MLIETISSDGSSISVCLTISNKSSTDKHTSHRVGDLNSTNHKHTSRIVGDPNSAAFPNTRLSLLSPMGRDFNPEHRTCDQRDTVLCVHAYSVWIRHGVNFIFSVPIPLNSIWSIPNL